MSANVEDSVGERILKNVMIRGQDGIMRERLLHAYIHTYIQGILRNTRNIQYFFSMNTCNRGLSQLSGGQWRRVCMYVCMCVRISTRYYEPNMQYMCVLYIG